MRTNSNRGQALVEYGLGLLIISLSVVGLLAAVGGMPIRSLSAVDNTLASHSALIQDSRSAKGGEKAPEKAPEKTPEKKAEAEKGK